MYVGAHPCFHVSSGFVRRDLLRVGQERTQQAVYIAAVPVSRLFSDFIVIRVSVNYLNSLAESCLHYVVAPFTTRLHGLECNERWSDVLQSFMFF